MSISCHQQIKNPATTAHSGAVGLLQRKCACGGTSGPTGECEECRKKKRIGLQTKLKVNEPGDNYEQEADRIADRVMATSANHAVSGAPFRIQRFSGQPTGQLDAAPASVDHALASPGRPLDTTLRQDMEQRIGHDFSRVRVHSGGDAEQSARDVNAHAYTVGHSIVFDAGRFAPGTHAGRRLIAHELTHVVQQSGGAPTVQREPTPAADPSAERPPAPISLDEQLEAQLDAEDALRLNWSKRKDKSYAWSLGLKDRARIRKNWKLSPKLQREITVKVRFFEGEAKAAYLRTIGPALEEFPEEAIDILAPPPSEEKSCPIGQTILVYQGKPGQGRCITENDTEFQQNYIDYHIVQADPLAIPNTTRANVDHNRVPQMQFTYKNGSTLVVDVKDIHLGISLRRRQTAGVTQSLTRYEKRSDGFIYPIRSDGKEDYVSYDDAENIVSLRAGLHDSIEELKRLWQLAELVETFGGPRGPLRGLGGMAGMVHQGALFEPVPRKTPAPAKTGTTIKASPPPPPGSPPKTTIKASPPPPPARPPAQTIKASPPPPPVRTSTTRGPTPVTDAEVVASNVRDPSSIKPQNPTTHQSEWQKFGGPKTGQDKAPLTYRDPDGNIRVSTDHWLLGKAGRAGIPPVSPGAPPTPTPPRVTTAPQPAPTPAKRDIGTADTGQAPAVARPDPLAKTPPVPPPAPPVRQPSNPNQRPGVPTGAAAKQSQQSMAPQPRTGPRWMPRDPPQAASPDVVQRAGSRAFFTVDHDRHVQAWKLLGGQGDDSPPAFYCEGNVYLDPSRWPPKTQ
jgi:hypothetical protein